MTGLCKKHGTLLDQCTKCEDEAEKARIINTVTLEPAAPEPLGDSEGTATQVAVGPEPVAWTTMPSADDWLFISGNENPNGKLIGSYYPLYSSADVERLQVGNTTLKKELKNISEAINMDALDLTMTATECIAKLHEQLAAMKQERDSFYMDYRMKCDVKTKALHEQLEAMVHKLAAAKESAEYAWKNTRVIDKSRMETEAKLAAMTQERNDHKATLIEALKLLSEANAREARLREALEYCACLTLHPAHQAKHVVAQEALSLPQDNSALREWGAKLLEDMADVLPDFHRMERHSVRDMLRRKADELERGEK